MPAIVQVDNISKVYGDVRAVDAVSFDVEKGDIVAIVGPNGSGKSTLVRMITGLIEPTSGTVRINGKSPDKERDQVGYVPQSFQFDKTLPITVDEFLAVAACDTHEHKSKDAIDRALNFVEMGIHRDKRLGALSGGQLQRILIARALLHERELLILDEPSSGVDVSAEKEIYKLLREINEKHGTTIIIISHALDFVTSFANTVLCINKQKVCYGSVIDMLGNAGLMEELYGSVVSINKHKHTHI